MSSPANSSLRPAWKGGSGRGFQPPPTVSSERRSQSMGSGSDHHRHVSDGGGGSKVSPNFNKFAALDDDDDAVTSMELKAAAEDTAVRLGLTGGSNNNNNNNSRSEGLRSSNANSGRPRGRSLADLAARAPPRERSSSHGSLGERSSGSGGGGGGGGIPGPIGGGTAGQSRFSSYVQTPADTNVIRYTRERLLSMRPQPAAAPPAELQQSIGDSVVLSETAQDPVCWDNFDGEAIWATVSRERRASSKIEEGGRRVSTNRREIGSSSGRWQRGVALPPPDQAKKSRDKDTAEHPSDLWDDPLATDAAADFSAFGTMPPDDNEPFDFDKMAEATRKFDEDFHGTRSRASSDANSEDGDAQLQQPTVKVDPKRPLASIGTTIQSGSGDDVNVFEDFDEPGAAEPPAPTAAAEDKPKSAIRAGDEDTNASSRLMAMIGVKKEPKPAAPAPAPEPAAIPAATTNAWGAPDPAAIVKPAEGASIPLNPWGGPLLPGQGGETKPAMGGFDLQARMREAEMEQKAREAEKLRRQQQEQEEMQRRAAEEQSRNAANMQQQQQQQQQQQEGVQSQVELVLMERISTILENAWGQSDLASILSTLHAEDSRVIPLLSNTDALRALIMRNPRRVALRPNPVFGTEMAALLMTNAQWQQEQQQAEAQAQHQQEMQRREQQQRQLQEQQQRAAAAAAAAQKVTVTPGAPWYYSDPQGNVQGPFRGEEMRQWLEAGYFKSDLPISQQQTGPFHPLSTIFPDLSVAFVSTTDTAAEEAAAREKARLEAERAEAEAAAERERQAKEAAEIAERERLAREAAERERQAEIERREKERLAEIQRLAELERQAKTKEEAERKAKEEEEAKAAAAAAAAKTSEAANESSSQLKMMLGLGAGQPAEKQAQKSVDKRGSKAANKSAPQPKAKEPAPVPAQPKPAASAWGGAQTKPVTRKSMSEIQKEEARAAAIQAMNQPGRSSSSGWANVAAARSSNVAAARSSSWVGGAPQQRPVTTTVKAAPVVQTRVAQPKMVKPAAVASQGAASQAQRASSSSNSAEEFGAKMSPALEKWCKDQMQRVNGTDDLTLVSFCMTLNDPVEIRQYLTTYLGSTSQVNNFATEFINRKSGATAQEEWETTANVKKSRKKKGGGR